MSTDTTAPVGPPGTVDITTQSVPTASESQPSVAHDQIKPDQQHQSGPKPVINRVATPLGLFVSSSSTHPSIAAQAPIVPDTITPAPSASPVHRDQHALAAGKPAEVAPRSSDETMLAVQRDAFARRTPNQEHNDNAGATESFPALEEAPLHTGMVRSNTKIVHPKPITVASPEVPSRPGTAISSVATLEATAERLSMTSSIDNAIRDLHGELKRSDSRRSSLLNAAAKDEPPGLHRHLSTSSSIVSTNTAARNGGYSPAGFVKSPPTGRIRSSSNRSAMSYEPEVPSLLSRSGPGKGSVRSVRSAKHSLAEISESEPVALDQHAMDQADVAPSIDSRDDENDGLAADAEAVPSTDAFHAMLNSSFEPSTEHFAPFDLQNTEPPLERPTSTHSADTYLQSQNAFADFDGVHCGTEASDSEQPTAYSAPVDLGAFDRHDYFQNGIPLRDEGETFAAEEEDEVYDMVEPPILRPVASIRRQERPQSYMDPSTGVEMFYYPAKVPAMLNLPPKLSNRPKAGDRNERRSKVLSAMWDANGNVEAPANTRRHSAMPNMNAAQKRTSFLPDLRRQYRQSFMALPGEEHPEFREHDVAEERASNPASPPMASPPEFNLRRPERLSAVPDKRKSRLSQLPSQLRASAYFDQPAVSTDLEVKDGSAMRTLDSMLDASASAPVSAFTDHLYAGKLGSEVYGKEKKRQSAMTLSPNMGSDGFGQGKKRGSGLPQSLSNGSVGSQGDGKSVKSRSSFMWLGKRSSSYNSQDMANSHGSPATNGEEHHHSPRIDEEYEDDASHVIRVPAHPIDGPADELHENAEALQLLEQGMGEGEDEEEEYFGPPTTLLAELQLRKQEQKERTKQRTNIVPSGTRATLLEMDAIAETQRKDRKGRRVNLAWEDPEAHVDQNGEDDEDVPLAIIAAKHQGAKNLADVERPIGLMERRDMEENEPLSHRRARLQGLDPNMLQQRPSTMLLAPSRLGARSPAPTAALSLTPEPVEEIEGETLADRRRRMNAKDGSDNSLPETRPVSRAFSAELLSQFGDLDEEEKTKKQKDNGAEETLGERRRRLQAEKMARNEEMGFSHSAPAPGQMQGRRSSMTMASVLGAHARKSPDLRTQEARMRLEQEEMLARQNEAKMAAMRMQMPQVLTGPSNMRSGGFMGGVYNNGSGGVQPQAHVQPEPQPFVQQQQHQQQQFQQQVPAFFQQSPTMFAQPTMPNQGFYGNGFGFNGAQSAGPFMGYQQPMMNSFGGYGMMPQGYSQANMGGMYPNSPATLYGGGQMMQQPMQVNGAGGQNMDAVERWRQGIHY